MFPSRGGRNTNSEVDTKTREAVKGKNGDGFVKDDIRRDRDKNLQQEALMRSQGEVLDVVLDEADHHADEEHDRQRLSTHVFLQTRRIVVSLKPRRCDRRPRCD